MHDADHITTLNRLVDEWTDRATAHAKAAEAYRLAHAKAFQTSDGKNADARKADADAATSAERLARELAEVARDAAYHRLIGIRGSAGERQQ